ncbi:MAG TPA: hypothetical protein VM186_09270, partial [Planctomycetota bacterium]|nr:hypothetical protein [Planctomycetota bacterium]
LQIRGRIAGDAGIAWADVTAAMDRIPHFHAVMFADEPRDDPKMFRMDIFYQQPALWRAQGRGYVQFQREGASKLFDIEKRAFVDPHTARGDMIPDDFVKQFETEGLLNAMLRTMFRGNVPPGEPVKSPVETTRGIDVFDYATDPMKVWARIWVLRESRLPIHLKVFQPRSDDFMLVVFDYSDPQPAEFFDPDAFEKAVKENSLRHPNQIYNVGTRPVGIKPRSSDQIYELSGGYKPGVVQQVVANDLGDLMVAWKCPDNMAPGGDSVDEGFENITDSWGNSYVSTGGSMPAETRVWRMFYTPMPPFKQGEGPRILSLEYIVRDMVMNKTTHNRQPRRLVLATPKIEVPAVTVTGYPADWQQYISPEKKELTVRRHVRGTGTLMQQLEYVNRMLDTDPLSLDANVWKMDLLRKHEREDEAWELFEVVIKDRLLADLPQIMGDGGSYVRGNLLTDYTHRLAQAGNIGEIDRILRLLTEAKEKALKEMEKLPPGAKDSVRRSIEGYFDWSKLPQVLRLSDNLRALAAAPKPEVVRNVHSDDGYVFIELHSPDEPFWRSEHGGPYPQQPACPVKGRRMIHLRFDAATRIYRMLLGGTGDVTSLTFRAVVSDEHPKGGYTPLFVDWTLQLDAQAADVESMKQWWEANLPGEEWPEPSAYEQAVADANELSESGDYARAAEVWRRALELQPDFTHMRPLMLKCLVKAGKLDAAFAELAQI